MNGINNFFYDELVRKHDKIRADTPNPEKEDVMIKAYDLIMHFQNVARKEGLLALEEEGKKLDIDDVTQEYFHFLLLLIVDGMEAELLSEIGMNRYIGLCLPSYDGLICLMYYRAGRMIQEGENPHVIDTYIRSMLPLSVLKKLELRDQIFSEKIAQTEVQDKIRKLCEDGNEIDEGDHSVVNQTAMALLALSDGDIQRLLREVDNSEIAIAMKALPGKARARIFDNLSQKLGLLLADDMAAIGPVRLSDAEESCTKIMKIQRQIQGGQK